MNTTSLGLSDDHVALAPYAEAWSGAFTAEAALLRGLLGAKALGVEHVGSTAIPGIKAKPILDIMLGIVTLDDAPDLAKALESLRYEFRPKAGIPEEHVFVKGAPRTHILHVVAINGPAWRQKLAFRDALRADPDLAGAYDRLKASLSDRFPTDRAAYTEGKTDFVRAVVAGKAPDATFLTRD